MRVWWAIQSGLGSRDLRAGQQQQQGRSQVGAGGGKGRDGSSTEGEGTMDQSSSMNGARCVDSEIPRGARGDRPGLSWT